MRKNRKISRDIDDDGVDGEGGGIGSVDGDSGIELRGIPSSEWERVKSRRAGGGHERYEFIDQFRGFIILLSSISIVTIQLGRMGLVIPLFTHGFVFSGGITNWNGLVLENYPYTLFDLGTSGFVFVIGLSMPISLRSRQEEFGVSGAFLRLLLRVGILMGIQALFDTFLFGISLNYRRVLLGQNSVFTGLAMGTLVSGVSTLLIHTPGRRFLVSLCLMGLHSVLYLIPGLSVFRHDSGEMDKNLITWLGSGNFFDMYMIPFELMSLGAISIAGSCFWDWLDKGNPGRSFRKYHFPVMIYSFMGSFIVAWFIPFTFFDLPASHVLLAIGTSFFFSLIFFAMNEVFKYKIPFLTALGRNTLVIFILGYLFTQVLVYIDAYDVISDGTAWLGLVFCTCSTVFVVFLGWGLHKKKVYVRI
ncbi:MAG: hypothetical protein ACTSUE_25830 [Promethearchaeota archaeon]